MEKRGRKISEGNCKLTWTILTMEKSNKKKEVVALNVHQWSDEWEHVDYKKSRHRSKPDKHMYVFSLSAAELKALSGIHRRTTKDKLERSKDLGVQRAHDEGRSKDIAQYVHYGGPYSELSDRKKSSGDYDDLRMPGWLPTAIVINIRTNKNKWRDTFVNDRDLIKINTDKTNNTTIVLPESFTGRNWQPTGLHPIEIIDGQHRLWAFDDKSLDNKYQLPVVAFHGLDRGWLAYLFWTINIKPKRINPSLAFDLYPLLRTESWLEKSEGHAIYRDTRAQDIVSFLWSHPKSPWHDHINMLGERGVGPMVTQSAWIKSLTATFVRSGTSRVGLSGGLFGEIKSREVLPWSRFQQTAFILVAGEMLRAGIKASKPPWAQDLRKTKGGEKDLAFYGEYSLLSTDQGIRAFLQVVNDFCYLNIDTLKLYDWRENESASHNELTSVTNAINSLEQQNVYKYLESIGSALADYDWRTSSTPSLKGNEDLRLKKAAFRGSGGYKELKLQLFKHLSEKTGSIKTSAQKLLRLTNT